MLTCSHPDGRYAPGELLVGTWQLAEVPREGMSREEIQGVEVSVLWYTEGKGDEDLAVHFFQRWNAARLEEIDVTTPQPFQTELPYSPLTYQGHLLRIRWCLRLRLFLADGRDLVTELPLTLSSARDAAEIAPRDLQ